MKRTILIITALLLLGFVCLVVALQLLPFGRDHTNPPIIAEPGWDSPQTRQLAKRACFDCHSNETVWPWYSNVAPISWLVARDVIEGREKLNFSEWGRQEQDVDHSLEMLREGEMPMPMYLIMHPEARLSAQDKQVLIQGFRSTFDITEEDERRGHGGDDD